MRAGRDRAGPGRWRGPGFGRLAGKGVVEVKGEGEARKLNTKNVILAMGSVPRDLPHIKADGKRILNSDHILLLEKVPQSMLVIGAGVTGLTTALCLRREGFDVTVVAEKFAPDIVSVVAGALWEWPPAVCGAHHDEASLARSREWCMTSYEVFGRLSKRPETGVFMRPVVFYFRAPISQRPRDLAKMNELKGKVRGFVHDARLIEDGGVNPAAVETARLMLEIGEDDDEERVSLRRRIANVLVQAGVRIDPMAAEGMIVAEDVV